MIDAAAQRRGGDPALLSAMVQVESAYNPNAVSPAGAAGLGQLMPGTAERFGLPADQRTSNSAGNVDVAARYVATLHRMFAGNTELVVAAYHAGDGAVQKHSNAVPPYRKTQDYVGNFELLLDFSLVFFLTVRAWLERDR